MEIKMEIPVYLIIVFVTIIGAIVSAIFMILEGLKSIEQEEIDNHNTYSGKLPNHTLHEQRRNFAYQAAVILLLISLIIPRS